MDAGRPAGDRIDVYDGRWIPAGHSPVRPHPPGLPLHGIARPGRHLDRTRGASHTQGRLRSGTRDPEQQVTRPTKTPAPALSPCTVACWAGMAIVRPWHH